MKLLFPEQFGPIKMFRSFNLTPFSISRFLKFFDCSKFRIIISPYVSRLLSAYRIKKMSGKETRLFLQEKARFLCHATTLLPPFSNGLLIQKKTHGINPGFGGSLSLLSIRAEQCNENGSDLAIRAERCNRMPSNATRMARIWQSEPSDTTECRAMQQNAGRCGRASSTPPSSAAEKRLFLGIR